MNDAADAHFKALVSFLVANEGLGVEWKEKIVQLAIQACQQVRMTSTDSRDVRRFLKVKKVSGGCVKDSSILRGIAFTRNVAHKKMRDDIEAPRLLLLGCAIEYERDNKFSVLANLAHQEREYLRIAVSKIVAQSPDVVLVERSVAGVAQAMLLEAGVTLVLNVKRSVLDRVARFTGAAIVPSIELLGASAARPAAPPKPARPRGPEEAGSQVVEGGRFRVLQGPGRDKPVVALDMPRRWAGPACCTVVLRGGARPALARAKAAVLFAAYAYQCVAAEAA